MKSLVVKDNRLIQASYALSLVEQRLVLMGIVGARNVKAGITPETLLTIKATDYAKQFGVSKQDAYQVLATAVETLFNRRATVDVRDNESGITEPMTVRWITAIKYNNSKATVTLRFGIEVIPLISRLEKTFTSYELQQISGLNSAYAIRCFEIVKQWQSVGRTPVIKLDDFKRQLGIADNEYTRIELFKRRVLTPSLKQINDQTGITVDYVQIKDGVKITGLQFTIKPKKQANHSTSDSPIMLTDKQISLFSSTLCYDPAFGNTFAEVGETTQSFKARIANELNDPERLKLYSPHLARLGFNIKTTNSSKVS